VREHGYAHHIIRLMVLGSYALQRGWDPAELTSWFHANFVDGYEWVMVPNGECPYRPTVWLGPDACPFTAATGRSWTGTRTGSRTTREWPIRSRAPPGWTTCARWSHRKRTAAARHPNGLISWFSGYSGGMAVKPMTGQAFFVLTALAGGPRHGYGIVSEVADLSQGRVKLKIGSLYGVLDRLTTEGLIEADREEAHDGRLRRYFRLTRDGRRALAEEAELRAATARVVRARLGLAGGEVTG
jgi:PadR family transcriptional regulator, regulatory protein PadR